MRWFLSLALPLILISWKCPTTEKPTTAAVAATCSDSGDTLKLDDLIFSDFFSPNGDGHNDTYLIVGLETCPPTNSLKVFNRWGEVVYLSSPYRNDWNGVGNYGQTFLGKQLTDGVYYFEFYNGKGNKANGKITIKR